MKAATLRLVFCAAWLLGGPLCAEQYVVPGLGTMALDVPRAWRAQDKVGPISVYLQLLPESGDDFNFQATSYWLAKDKLEALTTTLRARVESMARRALPGALEKEAPLQELKGKALSGYYFSLTDRATAPDPKGYKYLTQGMAVNGVGFTIFTLLQREPGMPERQQALDMLAGAIHSSDAPATPALDQDALRVEPGEERYDLWVPASRVYVTLPRARLAPVKNPFGGSTDNPRHFNFTDGAFIVSGWFEPAEKFSGVKSSWEKEMDAWKQKGLPAPLDVAFTKIRGWDAILYESPSLLGTNSHIRAHWVQAGTWIDIHLSMTSSAPGDKLRAALQAYLKSVLVRER